MLLHLFNRLRFCYLYIFSASDQLDCPPSAARRRRWYACDNTWYRGWISSFKFGHECFQIPVPGFSKSRRVKLNNELEAPQLKLNFFSLHMDSSVKSLIIKLTALMILIWNSKLLNKKKCSKVLNRLLFLAVMKVKTFWWKQHNFNWFSFTILYLFFLLYQKSVNAKRACFFISEFRVNKEFLLWLTYFGKAEDSN